MKKVRAIYFAIFPMIVLVSACSVDVNKETNQPNANVSNVSSANGAVSGARDVSTPASSPEAKMAANNETAEKSSSDEKIENRCGWFSNPTPSNAWLDDKDGQWIISTQGGDQAEGDWAEFPDDQWVATNGSYGYGCACMRVQVDRKNMRILKIVSARAKPLADCRRDKALTEPLD